MLNAGDEPINACFKHNLYSIPDADVQYEAGSFFIYNPFITVPANGESLCQRVGLPPAVLGVPAGKFG